MLRTIKLGEADRIVTILTQGHGKVRAVAKGVRKTGEPVRRPARADEPRRAAVLPGPRARRRHPGRDASTRTGRCARTTRCSPTRSRCSRRSTRSRRSASRTPALYRMLVGRAAHAGEPSRRPLVTPGVLLEAASLEGFHRMLDGCARCGDETRRRSPRSTSTRAACCASTCGRLGGRRLAARGARRCCGGCSAAGSTARSPSRPSAAHVHEVERLGIAALEHHVERRLRSTALL